MQISELARRASLTTRQLRHYEREGLLKPRRGPNGYRDYPPDGVAIARRVGLLVDLGFTTGELRSFLDRIEEPPRDAPDLASRTGRLERIDAAIAACARRAPSWSPCSSWTSPQTSKTRVRPSRSSH